jgi:putative ABC transport system ATP-binding protein
MVVAVDGFLLERVSVVRGAATVLWEVSGHLPGGRCSAVMGASGSGKTTLLRLLNRLIDPTAGTVLLDGVGLTGGPRRRRRPPVVPKPPERPSWVR